MNNLKRREQLKDEEYQGIFGVTKATFDKMLLILEEAYKRRHSKGGRPVKCLSVLDKLIITLGYYREYRTMRHIAFDYGVSKSMVHKSIHWVEDVLVQSKEFSLPSKRSLIETKDVKAVLVDVTECEIERPKKKQRDYYSGKKKRHTMKVQIVADALSRDILCISVGKGSQHDFKMFQESKVHFFPQIQAIADKGYQGIKKLVPRCSWWGDGVLSLLTHA